MLSSLLIISMLVKVGNIDGHYISQSGPTQYDEQTYFDIQKVDENNIKFQAFAYWTGANPDNVHTGVLNGIIPVKDGKAVYEEMWETPVSYTANSPEAVYDPKQPEKFQGCHVDITFKPDSSLRVEDNYRCGGLNVTFMGDYKRKSFIIPEWFDFDNQK